MEVKYTDRTQLKEYFKKNKIPKETDFSALIDASLNQRDDGVVKLPGDPLSIEAVGEKEGVQKLINFYKKLSDQAPAWSIMLNEKNANGDLFLGLKIGIEERSMLFISESGQIGIGTSQPLGKLNVVNRSEDANGGSLVLGKSGGSNLRMGYHDDYSWVQSHGRKPLAINPVGNMVGIGTASPSTTLHVKGSVMVEGGSVNFGVQTRQMLNLWNANYGVGVQSWTHYSRSDRNFAWYIAGTHSDGEVDAGGGTTAMVLRNGSLGVGTATPKELTHIAGNLALGLDANNQKFVIHPRTNGSGDFLQITHDDANGAWNWGNGIALTRKDGNVGISTTMPQKKLHVELGEVRVRAAHNNITADIGAFYAQNLTQGIGIGYNRIEAIGSNADQHICINPKGKGAILINEKSPLLFRRYANRGDNININTNMSAGEYTAAIVGFLAAGGDINEGGANDTAIIQVFMYISNGFWWLRADFKTHSSGNENWTVDVMFAVNALCSRDGYGA